MPCPLCGYDARGPSCRRCTDRPRGPGAISPSRGGLVGALSDGFRAIPVGLSLLVFSRRVKRLILIPMAITFGVFSLVFGALWRSIDAAFAAAERGTSSSLGSGEGWIARAVRWLLETPWLGWVGEIGQWAVFLVAAYFVAVWTFSLVYEVIAGPFLDAVHARLEARWFGLDPKASVEGRRSLAGVVRDETVALWTSARVAIVTGIILLLFVWLKFVPIVGVPLFFALAGFITAIGMLDIAFSRRRWSYGQRMAFLQRHALAVGAFGLVASALFTFLPVLGLLLTVPAASVGGLWLVIRLDKSAMRPDGAPVAIDA